MEQTNKIVNYWLAHLLGYRGIPMMSRPTFRNEFIGQIFSNLGGALLAPAIIQLIILKIFSGPDWLSPAIVSLSMLGLIAGGAIGKFLATRRRIPYIIASRLGISAFMISVACLPISTSSMWIIMGLLVPAFIIQSVVINIQSGIWQSNYPPSCRGKIISKILTFKIICLAVGAQVSTEFLDKFPNSYPYIYILAAIFFILSARSYSKIRIRREKSILAHTNTIKVGFIEQFKIVSKDKHYVRYLILQMLSGISVLSVRGIWVPQIKETFEITLAAGTFAIFTSKSMLNVIFAPISGHIFDRLGTMRFRVINTLIWVTSTILLGLGLYLSQFWLIIAGYCVVGIANATGSLVWNIGHTRFAPKGRGQIYMGVHQSLTGLRGVAAPVLGFYLFENILGFWLILMMIVLQLGVAVAYYRSPEPNKKEHAS